MADLKNYEIYKNTDFEVLTDTGYQDFRGLIVGENPHKIMVGFSDGTYLTCTPKHKFVDDVGGVIYAKDLSIGRRLHAGNLVTSTTFFESDDKVYDLLEVSGGHNYLINNKILSKNCLVIDEAAFIQPHIMDEFWSSVIPIISSSQKTKIFLVSCVAGDTYVYTHRGPRKISDFAKGGIIGAYDVGVYGILGRDRPRGGRLFKNSGVADTRIIKGRYGDIECTLNHKLWASVDGKIGWYKSEELSVGDYIVVQYGKNFWGNDIDISEFGERMRIPSFPRVMTNKLANLVGKYIATGDSGKDEVFKIFLRYLGFNINAPLNEMEIPRKVLSFSKDIMREVMRGIFDSKGLICDLNGIILFHHPSRELMYQVRAILNNFGVLCRIKYEEKTKRYTIYMGKNNTRDYYEKVGFNNEINQGCDVLLKIKSQHNRHDMIPIGPTDILKAFESEGLTAKELRKRGFDFSLRRYRRKGGRISNISRKKMLDIKDALPITQKETKAIFRNVDEQLVWCKILSIEEGRANVYDFSLPDIQGDDFCHSVVYNGIVGHQTANGTSNKFYEIYTAAERGESKEWHAEKMEWHEIPGRGKKFKQSMIESLGSVEAFNQEFGCCGANTEITVKKCNDELNETAKNVKISEFFDNYCSNGEIDEDITNK